jgi:hypothetical protein
MVYLKLNGAFWANCTIFKKKMEKEDAKIKGKLEFSYKIFK